jgi:LysM repeat protein
MSPRQGLIWWQNSPIHHNTLVSTRYVEAGTGFAANGTQNMYVLVVGLPSGAGTAPPSGTSNTSAKPLIVTPIELAEPGEDGSIVHILQQGQALWTVAAYYDVELDYLYLINILSPDDVLHPGDEVKVRLADGESPPPSPTPPFSHIVREGDSPWTIAGRYGISVDDFFWYNNLGPDSTLQPGDEVTIRLAEGQSPPPTPTPRTSHIVQAGESAWTIAAIYNLTVDQLLTLNALSSDTVLRPGDELVIRQPTATPPPIATVPASLPGSRTATPESNAENILASDLELTPTSISSDLSIPVSESTVIATITSAGNQNESESGIDWLMIAGIGLAIGAAIVLINARRRRR